MKKLFFILLFAPLFSLGQDFKFKPEQIGRAPGRGYKIASKPNGDGQWLKDSAYISMSQINDSTMTFNRTDGTKDTVVFRFTQATTGTGDGVTTADRNKWDASFTSVSQSNDSTLLLHRHNGTRDTVVFRFTQSTGGTVAGPPTFPPVVYNPVGGSNTYTVTDKRYIRLRPMGGSTDGELVLPAPNTVPGQMFIIKIESGATTGRWRSTNIPIYNADGYGFNPYTWEPDRVYTIVSDGAGYNVINIQQ